MTTSSMRLRPPPPLRLRCLLLLRAFGTAFALECIVRRVSLEALCDRFGIRFVGFDETEGPTLGLSRDVAHRWWAVEAVMSIWPWGRGRQCLRRSLVLGHLLAHLHPALRLEVRSVEPLEAHAFLVVRGSRLDMGPTGPTVVRGLARG